MVENTLGHFLLKRCGAASTCEGVVDVFRLSKSRNIIGRNNAKVDFFLNSTINKCLISRHHAEITVTQNNELLIKDSSLNGTFVNDVKIQGNVRLKAGDIVTFGHLTGAGIKPGTHSPQLNSEFSFVVQEISDSLSKQSVLNDAVQTFKEPSSPLNLTIRATSSPDITSPLPLPQQGTCIPRQIKTVSSPLTHKTTSGELPMPMQQGVLKQSKVDSSQLTPRSASGESPMPTLQAIPRQTKVLSSSPGTPKIASGGSPMPTLQAVHVPSQNKVLLSAPETPKTASGGSPTCLPTLQAIPRKPKVLYSPQTPKNAQSEAAHNSRNPKVKDMSGVNVVPHFDQVTSRGRAGMMVEIAGFAKLANSPTSVNGATVAMNTAGTGTRGQHSTTPVAKSPLSTQICVTPQRKVERNQTLSGNSSKPLVYILPKPSTSPTTPTTSRLLANHPLSSPSTSNRQKTVPKTPTQTPKGTSIIAGIKITSKDSGIYDDFRELDDDEEDMAVDSDGSDEDIFALASDIQAKVTNFIDDDDDNFSPHIPDSQNNNTVDLNESPIPGLDIKRNVSDDAEVPGSPVFDRCPSPMIAVVGSLNTQGSVAGSSCPSPVIAVVGSLNTQKTVSGSFKSTQGSQQKIATRNGGKRVTVVKTNVRSKKQKTKAGARQVKGQVVYEALEVCSSIDCCKPLDRKDTAAWVQCDNCDDWYHVDCVGCSYNRVKQSTAAFHCGCL